MLESRSISTHSLSLAATYNLRVKSAIYVSRRVHNMISVLFSLFACLLPLLLLLRVASVCHFSNKFNFARFGQNAMQIKCKSKQKQNEFNDVAAFVCKRATVCLNLAVNRLKAN